MQPFSAIKIALLLSYICVASISAVIITPALPAVTNFFELNPGSVEWVVSIFLFGYVIGQLIYGPLSNRLGTLNALRCGLLVNLVGIAACLSSVALKSYSLLLAGRFVTAIGSASGLACTLMLLHEYLDDEQLKNALAYTTVSFTIGIGLAVSIGGVVSQYLGWFYTFIVLLVHGVVALLLTWIFANPESVTKPFSFHELITGYRIALSNSKLIIFAIVVGYTTIISYAYSTAAPVITHDMLQLSPSHYGYWNLLNMVGMFLSGLVVQRLLKLFQPIKIIFLALSGCFISLLSLAAMSITHDSTALWFFITTMLLYFFGCMLFPCGSFYAVQDAKDKSNASGMLSFINMATAMLAVILMGYLPLSAINQFFAILAGCWLLVFILLLFRKMIVTNAQS